jgi:hypothetical protein
MYGKALEVLCDGEANGWLRGTLILRGLMEQTKLAAQLGASQDFIDSISYKQVRSIRRAIGLRTSEFI